MKKAFIELEERDMFYIDRNSDRKGYNKIFIKSFNESYIDYVRKDEEFTGSFWSDTLVHSEIPSNIKTLLESFI